jgi:hypothetical protein
VGGWLWLRLASYSPSGAARLAARVPRVRRGLVLGMVATTVLVALIALPTILAILAPRGDVGPLAERKAVTAGPLPRGQELRCLPGSSHLIANQTKPTATARSPIHAKGRRRPGRSRTKKPASGMPSARSPIRTTIT